MRCLQHDIKRLQAIEDNDDPDCFIVSSIPPEPKNLTQKVQSKTKVFPTQKIKTKHRFSLCL